MEMNPAPRESLTTASWSFQEGYAIHQSSGTQISLRELFGKARLCRVGLSAHGYYKTPELENKPFYYYTQGACISEVEIDAITGRVKLLSADIVMELGTSLDSLIDRGQIGGAFLQGAGWMTMEELVFDSKGELKTHSPSTYKIPLITDIPEHWTIEILPNPEFNKNIFKSKAVGEPPLLLSASVWLAVKNALHYRKRGPSLKVPATGENVLAAWHGREGEENVRLVVP